MYVVCVMIDFPHKKKVKKKDSPSSKLASARAKTLVETEGPRRAP